MGLVKANEFHHELARRVVSINASETEILCMMLLFHGCQISLTANLKVSGGVRGFAPITTRHAAEAASAVFDQAPQNNPDYWYEKWNGDWQAYAILEDVPKTLLPPLAQMKVQLESDDWVDALSDEDWDLVALLNDENAATGWQGQ